MIFVFGKHGQIASELRIAASRRGLNLRAVASNECDFKVPEQVATILKSLPDGSTVINTSSFSNIDQAESEVGAAMQINGLTPGLIAKICQQRGFRLIHISSSHVHSGEQKRGYREHEPTNPISVFGKSKLLGEHQILENLDQAIILRTSWVFSPHRKNFVKTILRAGHERAELTAITDQRGGPTSAESVANCCLTIAERIADLRPNSDLWGIYNFSGKPAVSRFEFAEEVVRQAKLNTTVNPVTSQECPTTIPRPANSVLACGKLMKNFEIQQSDWIEDLTTTLAQLELPRSLARNDESHSELKTLQEA